MSSLDFNNVRRGNEITVITILNTNVPAIEHWMEELSVTGWEICDAHTVLLHLGSDYPLETSLPVWPDMPEFTRSDQVSYFVSFYNKADMQKKLDEILSSKENADWEMQRAGEAARAHAYEEAFARDPGPFGFRRDL